MDKRVSAAVIRLDEAEALVELNHLTVPVVMMNPFVALVIDRDVGDIVDGDSDFFKGKVRSGAVPVAR